MNEPSIEEKPKGKIEVPEATKKDAINAIDPADGEQGTRFLKKDDLGPIMIVWSDTANRKRLQDIRGKFRKAMKGKWNGILLHLKPGETIGSMKLPQVQALYETLMQAFDSDLYNARMAKKAIAEDEARKAEEAAQQKAAHAIADRLEAIKGTATG